ncbi:Transcriptional regulatory protein BaeR [compost metagenome]|uniref:response regulator transcription factor n=1 Tax=Variovorax boronicumulans TaxID=436515 RepID=UPI000BB34491|nr:response regulator transcription factor [Variovorax boronicumulans]PBI89312.1 Transcriptional regulatory protein BaeR [Variovorax boronicumulans]
MKNERILIVEDDPQIAEVLVAYLQHAGFETTVARDGYEALRINGSWRPMLILLDQMLPGLSGKEVLAELRREGNVPVIMVTAMNDEADKLGALRYGADDYVVKPFNPKEVIARVQAILRRFRNVPDGPIRDLNYGDLRLDNDAVLVHVAGQDAPLDLTITEFKLLAVLMSHPGKAFTRFELLEASLPDSDALERVIDTHVHNLRKKLEERGITGIPQAVRGVGYRLGVIL